MKKFITYLSIFIFVLAFSLSHTGVDWDFWARIAVGKNFFETGKIFQHDYLSYTPLKTLWVDHEWGSGVVFWFIASRFGDIGMLLFKVFITFGVLFLISQIIKLYNKKKDEHLHFLYYLLIYFSMSVGFCHNIRCQMFTFFFFTLFLYLLERVRVKQENKWLGILPVFMLVWANLHGGFVSGLGLIFLYGLGEFLNKKPFAKYFIALVPSALITVINPYGVDYWRYIIEATSMTRPYIMEWQNSFVNQLTLFAGFWFKIYLAIASITIIYELKKINFDYQKIDKTKYILMLVCGYLAISHIKHQAFFVIVAGSFLYHSYYDFIDYLTSFLKGNVREFAENALMVKGIEFICIAIILFESLYLYLAIPSYHLTLEDYPLGCVEFVKKNKIEGNLLSLFHWGSYIAWKLYPQNLIAIDGRYEEVYPEETFMGVRKFLNNEKGWYSFQRKYPADVLIVPHQFAETNNALVFDPNWKPVYKCENANVFVRKELYKGRQNYIQPNKNQDYYLKTKFQTDINFSNKKLPDVL